MPRGATARCQLPFSSPSSEVTLLRGAQALQGVFLHSSQVQIIPELLLGISDVPAPRASSPVRAAWWQRGEAGQTGGSASIAQHSLEYQTLQVGQREQEVSYLSTYEHS